MGKYCSFWDQSVHVKRPWLNGYVGKKERHGFAIVCASHSFSKNHGDVNKLKQRMLKTKIRFQGKEKNGHQMHNN